MQNVTRAQTLVLLDVKSPSALERMTGKELELVLSQLGVTPMVGSRKADLLALVKREMRKPREAVDTSATVVTLDAVEANVLAPAQLWDGDNKEVARVYFEELKRLTIEQWDSLHQRWMPPTGAMYAAAARLATDIGGLRNGSTGELLAPETRLTIARDVFSYMKAMVERESHQYYYEQLVNNYSVKGGFRDTTFQGLGTLSLSKKQRDAAKVVERKQSVITVDCTSLLRWSHGILTNLDTVPESRWYWVSYALAFVTGRRMAEIHDTAQFSYRSPYSVLFTGQLKEKTKANPLSEAGYEIPTLVDSALVIAGLDWLNTRGKRLTKLDTATVNRKYSGDLSKYIKPFYAERLGDTYKGNEDRFKYHSLRQLYVLCAESAFRPSGVQDTLYKASILGHNFTDSQTTGRYESDFELADNSEVKL